MADLNMKAFKQAEQYLVAAGWTHFNEERRRKFVEVYEAEKSSGPEKYAYCAFYDGVCKAMVADLRNEPKMRHITAEAVAEWINDGAEIIRLPVEQAKEAYGK